MMQNYSMVGIFSLIKLLVSHILMEKKSMVVYTSIKQF